MNITGINEINKMDLVFQVFNVVSIMAVLLWKCRYLFQLVYLVMLVCLHSRKELFYLASYQCFGVQSVQLFSLSSNRSELGRFKQMLTYKKKRGTIVASKRGITHPDPCDLFQCLCCPWYQRIF